MRPAHEHEKLAQSYWIMNTTSLREKILAPGWGEEDTSGFLNAAQNLVKYLVLKPNAGFES